MNHHGYIYQACNFLYTGCTKQRTDIYTEPGKHSRHYSGDDVTNPIRKVRSAKHRYVYFATYDKREKQKWKEALSYPIQPYPKGDNSNYKLGEYLQDELLDTRTGETYRVANNPEKDRMKPIYIFDFEVFAYDWLVVIKSVDDGTYLKLHNDPVLLENFIGTDPLLGGFNNKNYDNFILKGILAGLGVEDIKAINDYIIAGGNGWECPVLKGTKAPYFDSFDLMDDCQKGLSLKAIEGHLGMDIRESKVDFNLDRPLTPDELEETFFYCTHDVDATCELLKLRKSYLDTKVNLGNLSGISDVKSLYMTNAKLTAAYLHAEAPVEPWTDEREYQLPTQLHKEVVPPEVLAHFEAIHDLSIPSETYFKSKCDLTIGECETRIAFGGIHGAIRCYQETESDDRIIRNYDVASYYPHLMTLFHYTSRNIPDPKIYEDMLEERMAAKKAGDKVKANALKLVANTTYGASLNRYNALYDPKMGRSVCITGQLFLIEMACTLVKECPELRIIQLNTDGIMISFARSEYDKVKEITDEWQARTGFELEEDKIHAIIQKDVNNYIEIADDGGQKIKGGYLVRGIAPAGAFNINNNTKVVSQAITNYFTKGISPEETIEADNNILDYQMIAKASSKYREAYLETEDGPVPVQKINRVYATSNPRYGKLVKIKMESDGEADIPSLPDHCLLDNDNHLTIKDIDKNWYIQLARKQINDFKGIKPEKKGRKKKMAETKAKAPMNVYAKLAEARNMFLECKVQQSGKNNALEFLYFELKDIVPAITPIALSLGLVFLFNLETDVATLTVLNTENPDETIVFTMPYKQLETNRGTNVMQALGATDTYLRRYLYLNALDIVVQDEIDPNLGKEPATVPVTPVKEKPKAPVTVEERKEIKQELTAADGPADEVQLGQLKKILGDVLKADPTQRDGINQFAVESNAFKNLTKRTCADAIVKYSELLANVSKKEG